MIRSPNVTSQFPEMPYEEGNAVRVTGPRGSRILVIHKKYSKGKFQMRDGDKVLSKIYDEADLSPARDLV